jgi:hypothetical protein
MQRFGSDISVIGVELQPDLPMGHSERLSRDIPSPLISNTIRGSLPCASQWRARYLSRG